MLYSQASSASTLHIPDGFLSVLVSLVFWIVSAIIIAVALRRVQGEIGERELPLMGVMAAAIFAGQMINFSIVGGTSGHLLGAALATILLGPWSAILIMTAVVSVQALVFQDGGILTLGANLFNMGVIGVSVAYASYTASARLLRRASWGLNAAGFVSGWFSIFIAALSCGLQLAWSGVSPARIVLPAMAGIHALIGLGEGLITAGALVFLSAARPALRDRARAGNRTNRGVFSAGILFSLLLIVLSPLASTQPDGLFWVAGQSGFLDKARSAVYQIFPNYSLPGFTNPALARVFAGTLGLVIVTAVTYGLARRGRRDVVKKPREVE